MLLACSGGLDSATLAHLLHRLNWPFALAHCNFKLRGEESDGDEQFVAALAKSYNVPFHSIAFDTEQIATQKKQSTQLAARELRYEWLEKVRSENKFDYILTAHHLNDNIETAVHHFIKGTGIRGLRGIPIRNGKVLRPLLFALRKELENYQQLHQLEYRQDASNASEVYTRNKIRHSLIPIIESINPGFEQTMAQQFRVMNEVSVWYETKVQRELRQLFLKRGNETVIPILKLKKTINARTLLFEFLKPHDFTISQIDDMLAALDSTESKQFLTEKARIIKDRRFLILSKNDEPDTSTYLLEKETSEIQTAAGKLSCTWVPADTINILADKNQAYLNADMLEFPLLLRHRKRGDYFYPFGMNRKKKKLSKFFKDAKLHIGEKEQVWVLESGKKIAWLVNHRIDERYRITPATKNVLHLKWQPR